MQPTQPGCRRVYSLLLASPSDRFNQTLLPLLPPDRFPSSAVISVSTATDARRKLVDRRPDLLLINAPLPDESGISLATDACRTSASGVLLLVRAEQYADLCWQATAAGVLVLSKPTSSQLLLQTLTLLCGTRERLRLMEQKAVSMEDKMEEIRIVNRAKWVLIAQLRMTEQEAYRYIEKQAMDRCETRRAVAESILATYR